MECSASRWTTLALSSGNLVAQADHQNIFFPVLLNYKYVRINSRSNWLLGAARPCTHVQHHNQNYLVREDDRLRRNTLGDYG